MNGPIIKKKICLLVLCPTNLEERKNDRLILSSSCEWRLYCSPVLVAELCCRKYETKEEEEELTIRIFNINNRFVIIVSLHLLMTCLVLLLKAEQAELVTIFLTIFVALCLLWNKAY